MQGGVMAATRERLEAVIRRALSDVAVAAEFQPSRGVTDVMNRATETILTEAGEYVTAEVGLLTAEERREILYQARGDIGGYPPGLAS
jgi:hypothetical protein